MADEQKGTAALARRPDFTGSGNISEMQVEFLAEKARQSLRSGEGQTYLRIGVRGRAKRPSFDTASLLEWQKKNDLVYSCVEKIADASMDPGLVIQEQVKGEWQEWNKGHLAAHPLAVLLARPNPHMDEIDFRRAWVVSEHIAGVFYAEIVRDDLGLPIELWPLNPAKVTPHITREGDLVGYLWQDNGIRRFILPEDMLVRKALDLTNPHNGLAPLAVALGSVDADAAQTDFVRSFFAGGGQPSGVITVPGIMGDEQMEQTKQQWMFRYGRKGAGGGPAVLQNGATYNKVGANPDEVESSEMRQQFEARICGVFGVPPALVGAYVGLKQQNNRASAKAAMEDFWVNKMSPLFKRWRYFLTMTLLAEFEPMEAIVAGRIRVFWDMSEVMALQDDVNDKHKRSLEALQGGAITLNQYLTDTGRKPAEGGDIYYLPSSLNVVPAAEIGLPREGKPSQLQLTDGGKPAA